MIILVYALFFQEKVARPVKPNGRLTYDYRQNANAQIAMPSRTLIRMEKKKVRPSFEKNSTYEERLYNIDKKRIQLQSICSEHLESESDFLFTPESLSTDTKSKMTNKSAKVNDFSTSSRPRNIINQSGIVDCLIETSDMSICSSVALPAEEELSYVGSTFTKETVGTLRSGFSISEKSTLSKSSHESRWHPEALRRARGEGN